MTWHNWAGTASADPARRYWPRSAEEIADAIKDAAGGGLTVRALGGGHSFTPAAATSGAALDLSGWTGIVGADLSSGLITARSGTTIRELNRALDSLGLAMPNLGDIDAQTISGAISTGTHGTGPAWAGSPPRSPRSSWCWRTGRCVSCSAEERPELFNAARVSVGALGVISTVTLQCVPAFTLAAHEAPMRVDQVLERFDEFAAGNDHFEFYWFPYGSNALLKQNNRTVGAGDGVAVPSPMPGWRRSESTMHAVGCAARPWCCRSSSRSRRTSSSGEAAAVPPLEERIHRLPRRQIDRQRPPLHAVLHHVGHRVAHRPQVMDHRAPDGDGELRHHLPGPRLQHGPLRIGEVRGIARPAVMAPAARRGASEW